MLKRSSILCSFTIFLIITGSLPIVFPQNATKPGNNTALPEAKFNIKVPPELHPFVKTIQSDTLGGQEPLLSIKKLDEDTYRIKLTFHVEKPLNQDDWQLNIMPAFNPDFHWAPHLTPTNEHIIDQHSFRSPALIISSTKKILTLIPDLEIMSKGTQVRWYMDLDARNTQLTLGMSNYSVKEHVLYIRKSGATYQPEKVEIGFFLFTSTAKSDLENPWRKPLSFLWKKWGKPLFESGLPLPGDLEPYVKHT